LQAIVNNLDNLNPERVRVIIRFAQRCAMNPYEVSESEFEKVRDCGISNEELVEIVSLAALGNYIDTLADALKLETDDMFARELAGGQLVTRRR
jgi:alkylhydroperoxidase family enzyme